MRFKRVAHFIINLSRKEVGKMVTREDLKNLSNEDLKNIYWLIFEARKLTGKNLEEEIIKNYLLLDKLLNTDNEEEAKTIENMLLENMKKKLEWEED